MREILSGQYRYDNSPIHNLNAVMKLLLVIVFLTMVVLTETLWGFLCLGMICMGAILLSHSRFKMILRPIFSLWTFYVIIFCMNTLFYQTETPILSYWIFHPSYEGMRQGAIILIRLFSLMIIFSIFIITTSPVEITKAIAICISPLKIFKIPTDDIAMIISVALQFIPVLLQEAQTIKKAQIARGAHFESTRLRDRAKSVIPMVIPIFIAAFRRADELSQAMEARGYCSQKEMRSKITIHQNLKKRGQST